MKQTYEYMHVTTSMDSICIEDISQCNIIAYNDDGESWIISIHTSLGEMNIIELGPFIDSEVSDINFFMYKKDHFQYNEKKLDKRIDNFINEPRRCITQVDIIDDKEVEEYLQKFKNSIL